MKRLKDILNGFKFEIVQGEIAIEVKNLHFDSRLVSSGDVFIAIQGEIVDGHDYIQSAIDKGCRCVISEKNIDYKQSDLTLVVVDDSSVALALMASAYFDYPSKKLNLIGITGTNGKTSVCWRSTTSKFSMENCEDPTAYYTFCTDIRPA